MDPGADVRIAAESRKILPEDEEHVVESVFGFLGVAEQARCQAVDCILEAQVAGLEGGRLAAAQPLDQVRRQTLRAVHDLARHPP